MSSAACIAALEATEKQGAIHRKMRTLHFEQCRIARQPAVSTVASSVLSSNKQHVNKFFFPHACWKKFATHQIWCNDRTGAGLPSRRSAYKRKGRPKPPPLFRYFRYQSDYVLTEFKRLSCDVTDENDCEIADCKLPEANPNTTATRRATNARMAPYSVIPCPDSSSRKERITSII